MGVITADHNDCEAVQAVDGEDAWRSAIIRWQEEGQDQDVATAAAVEEGQQNSVVEEGTISIIQSSSDNQILVHNNEPPPGEASSSSPPPPITATTSETQVQQRTAVDPPGEYLEEGNTTQTITQNEPSFSSSENIQHQSTDTSTLAPSWGKRFQGPIIMAFLLIIVGLLVGIFVNQNSSDGRADENLLNAPPEQSPGGTPPQISPAPTLAVEPTEEPTVPQNDALNPSFSAAPSPKPTHMFTSYNNNITTPSLLPSSKQPPPTSTSKPTDVSTYNNKITTPSLFPSSKPTRPRTTVVDDQLYYKANAYCGTNWIDAYTNCLLGCPSGMDSDCSTLGDEYSCHEFTQCDDHIPTIEENLELKADLLMQMAESPTFVGRLSDTTSYAYEAFLWLGSSNNFDELSEIQKLQRYGLVTLYLSTSQELGWKVSNGWKTDDHECQWFGISCAGNAIISEISLPNNRMSGTIPPEIALAGVGNKIGKLDLSENKIRGKLVDQLGQLTQLEVLDLRANDFTGNVPSQIGDLSKLQSLQLQSNDLTGAMPPGICALTVDGILEELIADCDLEDPFSMVNCDVDLCCSECY